MGQERYAKIEELVEGVAKALGRDEFTIIEIGVWNGGRAMRMAEAAFKGGAKNVKYIGFDLFDQATPEINLRELNAKPNQTLDKVRGRLDWFKASHPGFTFTLVKGNTNKTLAGMEFLVDFVYIDGGHSVETIANDYAAFKDCPLVVFDDYYFGLDEETLDRVGANRTVDALQADLDREVVFIDTGDELKMGEVRGIVGLAVVRRLERPEVAGDPMPPTEQIRDNDIEGGKILIEGTPEAESYTDEVEMTQGPVEVAEGETLEPRPKRAPRKRATPRKK